ncbi:MAG: hypothetical protein AAGB46_18250 [Verrucomicrobiota bacterium]
MNSHSSILSFFAALLLFSGCNSTSVEEKENEKVPVMITKGMTSEQLVALIGQPSKVKIVRDPAGDAEIWEYVHTENTATRLAQTGQTMTPYINPITGQRTAVIDETLTRQTTVTKDTLEILIQNGVVMAWKQSKETEERYDE